MLCPFNRQRLNLLMCNFFCFFGGGAGYKKKMTHLVSTESSSAGVGSFSVIGRGNLQIVFTPTTTVWVGRPHTSRALTPAGGKKIDKKKKKTCDFPRHLDYSCEESVDRKPRVCSQQEIQ